MTAPIYDTIAKKRDGKKHSAEEILAFVKGFCSGEIADYQVSAWLMAVCINGLDPEETTALTRAMIDSGESVDLLTRTAVDKHSTGGVGDKTSTVLAPLLAAAGLTVAKMSGRGLGITGGTVDKLESIPGFSTDLTKAQFLRQAEQVGCVLAGQSADLAPADKRLYALRDVTATVESIPLIASSIMSKKIASGAKVILLDVKYGSGAFMKTVEAARELAFTMIGIGNGLNRRTCAAITRMDEPLGRAVGNAVEVAEAIETLHGRGPNDLEDLCIELALMLTTSANSGITTKEEIAELISSGAALAKLRQMIAAQGGDARVADDPSLLPSAKHCETISASVTGYVQSVDARNIALAAGALGAGRRKKEDTIDHTAGVILTKKRGEAVRAGEEIAKMLYSGDVNASETRKLIETAFVIGQSCPEEEPVITEKIGF